MYKCTGAVLYSLYNFIMETFNVLPIHVSYGPKSLNFTRLSTEQYINFTDKFTSKSFIALFW